MTRPKLLTVTLRLPVPVMGFTVVCSTEPSLELMASKPRASYGSSNVLLVMMSTGCAWRKPGKTMTQKTKARKADLMGCHTDFNPKPVESVALLTDDMLMILLFVVGDGV